MTVSLRLPGALRPFAREQAVVGVDVAAGADVTSLLDRLREDLPGLERRLRDEQGRLRPHVNLFLGTVNVRNLDGLATVLPEGAEVTVLPAVSGGG